MIDSALACLHAGLCVLPAILGEKRPALSSWRPFQSQHPTEEQLRSWFNPGEAMCLLTGAISGNLEMLDFDNGGELFDRWRELVDSQAPGLVERLVIERSQSGGRHVVYRCMTPVPGSRKLAQRVIEMPDGEEVVIHGKRYRPRRVDDRFLITLTLIETRGEGGLFLCAPTPGYELEQGALSDILVLDETERTILIEAACVLNEATLPAERHRDGLADGSSSGGRPGDDFNTRGDVREILCRHSWQMVRDGDNQLWRRPGKAQGWSATLRGHVFYVFSSNAAPFEPDRAYAPFSVYALLEHDGDFSAAAVALRGQGFGGNGDDSDVDLSRICPVPTCPMPSQLEYPDPGPLPEQLLRLPGFVSAVMDHCLETAPYPNLALAFCGALALQAVIAGRKVRDAGDNRTNIYLLALAYSAVGKDWPRKLNMDVMHRVGLVNCLGEKFASGEGIEDALFVSPTMMFQTDEIDGLLQSINKARDARYENILGTLLTMYSAANSIHPMRRKAGMESSGLIDQPCLVMFGTAIPTQYYEAMSERMLTNGFFARTIIVESGPRGTGQDPGIINPPESVVETAQWWADFRPGTGDLNQFHPQPRIVEADDDARLLLTEARHASEEEYTAAESRGDPVGTTVWGRVPEHIRKLSLLYAVSENHESPRIGTAAVRWATDFMMHQTRRMLFMAHTHVAPNPFNADCLKLLRKLRESPGRQLDHSVLLKRMKIDAKRFVELITTLVEQGDIVIVNQSTAGRPQRIYRLVEGGEGIG